MPGRFFLGLGAGENLNEHVTGERWPSASERREMLEEAILLIRLLWEGGNKSHRGFYFTAQNAVSLRSLKSYLRFMSRRAAKEWRSSPAELVTDSSQLETKKW